MRTCYPLKELLAAALSLGENGNSTKAVYSHLQQGCLDCLKALEKTKIGVAAFFQEKEETLSPRMQQTILQVKQEFSRQRLINTALQEVLSKKIPSTHEWLTILHEKPELLHAHTSMLLSEQANKMMHQDLQQAEHLFDLAKETSDKIPGSEQSTHEGARALALGEIFKGRGVILGIKGSYTEAGTFLDLAARYFEKAGDECELASVWMRQGIICTELKDYEQALALYARAEQIFSGYGQDEQLARVEIAKGNAHQDLGDWQNSLLCYDRALSVVAGKDLMLEAHCNVEKGHCLSELGQKEAIAFIEKAAGLYEKVKAPVYYAKTSWTLGLYYAKWGSENDAMKHYLSAKKIFSDEAIAVDLALVCLDMARIHLNRKAFSEALAVCREALPPLQEQNLIEMHRAMSYISEAVERQEKPETLLGLLGKVAGFIQEANLNPALKFNL